MLLSGVSLSPMLSAPGQMWRTLVFSSCIQKGPSGASLVCEDARECDCASSLARASSLLSLVTAFSALIYGTIFLAGSLFQPQAYPVAARMVVPKPEDALFLLGFSPSMTPTNLRIRFTWNSRLSTIWPSGLTSPGQPRPLSPPSRPPCLCLDCPPI